MSARGRIGLSLIEVVVAGLILAAALVPAIDLFTGSQVEVVKSRSRLIASGIVSAVAEDMRARPASSRVGFAPVAADALPAVAALLNAYRAHGAAGEAAARADLAGFSVQGLIQGPPEAATLVVTVAWRESGIARTLIRSVPLGVDP